MYRRIATMIAVLTIGFSAPAFSESIYIWTDADGNKRFSDQPPPEGTQDFQTTDELETSPEELRRAEEEHSRMVREIGRENERREQEEAESAARRAAERQRNQALDRSERIFSERLRLQREIDKINNRGMSKNFGPGQKDALVQEIQKKIDQLDSDPDAYFKK